ncbi:RagB/SusD family nutrient uptake outer membrane protein [Pedobacter sp. BMA]|uniref:RagB/SusD family nutrient uptake outer membrane protein n=1 Tax=Pedobacter sp. BMA TaxID=1663685 RepID=UPI00069D07E3|nr:RagB/SusD family nutrient uptake outer membrane protein [Pedobacter sp. BMA]
MKIKFNLYIIAASLSLVLLSFSSCKKYVEAKLATNLISKDDAFASDNSATSATLSLYSNYSFLNSIQYETWASGLSADELQNTTAVSDYVQFTQNVVSTTNGTSSNYIWGYSYQVIRYANLIIDGLDKTSGVSATVKNQLTGEAKFFRAFMFLNLVNLYGGVPLTTDPVELNNATKPRASVAEVYAQVISDLKDAQNLLPTAYVGTAALRVRVNKWAATALLARAYLYNKDYVNAEAEATKVIGAGTYTMATTANAFINTSSETILQLSSLYGASGFTSYRTTSSANNIVPPIFVLSGAFTKDFEMNDNRKTTWVDSTTYNAVKYYRINKYKVQTATASTLGNEYTVLLRLAEQYLIRAEARAQQSNITGAQADINIIRARAGLGNTTASTTAGLLTAVAKERKLELFGEYSHRWFDLKRMGLADAVLGSLKTTYKSSAQLFPIPSDQILLNANLTQNPGY